ncbi:MAG: hypothetical protein DWB42_13565 [Chloroflexi bacterium]|nr:hypothetical protein [Chloroflexota bacterium]
MNPNWCITEIGGGRVLQTSGHLRLVVPPTPSDVYSDAQISDYNTRRDFRRLPPARLTVKARGEGGPIRGTAGFGFWNHPFAPGERGFRLPRAAWFFFASPPNNMRLALDVPGSGWKCATIHAGRAAFWALLPAAPLGFLLMRVPALYRRLWPVGQRALAVSEYTLDPGLLAENHTYALDWHADGLAFRVDGVTVHQTRHAPAGPLGFIAWIDNQYAVVTPQGRFGWGIVPVEREQALILETIRLETL